MRTLRRTLLMILMTALAAMLLTATSLAATPAFPFNGAWKLDLQASQGVPPMMQGHQTRIHLKEDQKTFVITFIFDGRIMNVSTFDLDGRAHELPMFGAPAKAVATRLQGGREIRLVIRRPEAGGQTSVETITFTLSSDGHTIRRVSRITGGAARPPQVYIYRRLEPQPRPVS